MKSNTVLLTISAIGMSALAGCASISERVSDVAQQRIEQVVGPDGADIVATGDGFTPGGIVLFEEDFSGVGVGEFPSDLLFVRGAMEVVTWDGHTLLRGEGSEGDFFTIPLSQPLPESFTLEFDLHDQETFRGMGVFFGPVPDRDDPFRTFDGPYVRVGYYAGSGVVSNSTTGPDLISTSGTDGLGLEDGLVRIQIQVDGDAVKVFAGGEGIANVPRADLGRSDAVTFFLGSYTLPILIDNIRLAAAL